MMFGLITANRLALLSSVITCACLTPPTDLPPVSQESIAPESYMHSIEDRFIVLLESEADPNEVAARYGIRPFIVYQAGRYVGFAAQLTQETRLGLALDPEVRTLDADLVAVAYSDTTNGVARIEADHNALWRAGSAIDVDVAILDTGIDSTHSDLDVMGGMRFVTGTVTDFSDGHGHGTHVAGTIAALDNDAGMVGVAPGARLWAGKVLDDNGNGTMATIAAGVDWAVGLGIPVINISAGIAAAPVGDCSDAGATVLHLAVCNARDMGSTVVVAAGNDFEDVVNHIPAAYDEVITVSALADFDGLPGGLVANNDSINGVSVSDRGWGPTCSDATSTGWPTQQDDALAEFSNFGADVDLIAPGFCVMSTTPGGGYGFDSGTSMAAAHVAGAAAVYLHNHPGATPTQVRAALLERAHPSPCDGAGGACVGDSDGVQEPLAFLGHYDESFETETVASEPASVTHSNGSATALITAADAYGMGDSGDQSLALEITSLSNNPDYARVEFCLPEDAESHFYASFAVNFQQLVEWNPIVIFADGNPGEMLYWWWVDAAGAVLDDQQVGTFATDTWHRVTIDIDRGAGVATFDVDGVGVSSLLSVWDAPTTPMRCLAFTTWSDELQSVALDDVLVTSFDYAPAPPGYVTYAIGAEVFRVQAVEGVTPLNLSSELDTLGTSGVDLSPAASRNGDFLTIITDRFDAQCDGWECVALLSRDLSTAETVIVDGSVLRPYQGRAAISNGGDMIVYTSQDIGPNSVDLLITQKVGGSWTSPQLLTGASTHDFNEQAAFSSDASTILFDCGPTSGGQVGTGICEVRTDGTGFVRIIDPNNNPLGGGGIAARHADYTSSGAIVFEADWASEQIWVLKVGSVTPEQIIPEHGNDNSPCALPNGSFASLHLLDDLHELKITAADGFSSFILIPGVDISDVGMSCHN